jgi:hypothetical protein
VRNANAIDIQVSPRSIYRNRAATKKSIQFIKVAVLRFIYGSLREKS